MSPLEALILGIIQGLTEFLPVSSSGHLQIGAALLGTSTADNLLFTVIVHGATVLSTIIVFWKEIINIFKGLFKFQMNEETKLVIYIILSTGALQAVFAVHVLPLLVPGHLFSSGPR